MDNKLPSRPDFFRCTYTAGGEKHECYMRNSLEVLRELYGRPDFANDMMYAPEKRYGLVADGTEKRMFSEMNTSRWWWNMQVCYLQYTICC